MEHKVIVIGGANADIAGTPSSDLIIRDSIPGKISVSPGGVGRNIAAELVKLGVDVSLIVATGDDIFGSYIRNECASLGIDMSMSLICPDKPSSLYLYINDIGRDMYVAVNDMDIVNEISSEYLSQYIDIINTFDACVIDANLSPESLVFLAENITIPIIADPVSTTKAKRIVPILDKIYAVKPNKLEKEILGDCPCLCFESLGENGMCVHNNNTIFNVDAPVVSVECTTGCGDAACAAIVFGIVSNMSVEKTAMLAVNNASKKAAKIH